MKTRFSLLLLAVFVAGFTHAIDTIRVSDPQTWTAKELVPYANQTVIFDVPMVVCSNNNGITVSTRRLFTPTNQVLPKTKDATSYNAIVSLNSQSEVKLVGAPIAKGDAYYRCGEKIYNLTAKVNGDGTSLTWISGDWQGNSRVDLEKGVPDINDYRLLVCAYNIENYAGTSERQRIKITKALKVINADIYGFIEISGKESVRDQLVVDINSHLPERNYRVCKEKTGLGEDQTVAFVYDSKTVKPLGNSEEFSYGTIHGERHRMRCFEEIATGERFILSVNHFKAKSGSGKGGDADLNDGQSSFNAQRVGEAQTLISTYNRWSSQIEEKDILIMGDLNSLGKEDPITTFTASGMIDLHRAFHADSSYSYSYSDKQYNYQQLAGYLDHALCNTTMRPQITCMAAFHINSDESDKYTWDKSSDVTMFRGSDHDPVVVGLKLDGSLVYDPKPRINTEDILFGDSKQLIIRNALKDGQSSFYGIYDISGHPIVSATRIESSAQAVDLPTAPGIYILYVYYNGNVYPYKMIVR